MATRSVSENEKVNRHRFESLPSGDFVEISASPVGRRTEAVTWAGRGVQFCWWKLAGHADGGRVLLDSRGGNPDSQQTNGFRARVRGQLVTVIFEGLWLPAC